MCGRSRAQKAYAFRTAERSRRVSIELTTPRSMFSWSMKKTRKMDKRPWLTLAIDVLDINFSFWRFLPL